MAQTSDRIYFPPLEDCLKGDEVLLPWRSIASALSDGSSDRLTGRAVSNFLKDAYVLSLVKSPARVFDPPSAQSKTDFETKTAAINVTPTPNDRYNIRAIKEDAAWLSQCVNIGEVAALRIVAVELQSRPQSHLTGPLSSQDVVNIREAAGSDGLTPSSVLAAVDITAVPDAAALWSQFDKQESRRSRLLSTYLSERRYFMMSVDYIISLMLQSEWPASTPDLVRSLHKDILEAAYGLGQDADIDAQALMPVLSTYLETLQACIRRCHASVDSVFKDQAAISDDLAFDWVRTSLTEAVHCMTAVFQILDLSGDGFATSNTASRWFQIMEEWAFLDSLTSDNDILSELIAPLQSLVCAISLVILNLDKSIPYLEHDLEIGGDDDAFIADSDALPAVNKAIMAAAAADLISPRPIIFAWTLILHRMHSSYQERAERRDLAQNQKAQAGFELENQLYPSLTRRNSAGSIVSIESARYDRFLTEIGSNKEDWQLIEKTAITVTSGGQLYEMLDRMAICGGATYGAALRPSVGTRVRLAGMGLLKASFPLVGYQSEPVGTLISTLSGGQQYWDLTKDVFSSSTESAVGLALNDDVLLQFYVLQAQSRYPYEFMPFASFCRILSTYPCADERVEVAKFLLTLHTVTFRVPASFRQIELINEDENTNSFQTMEDIPLFPTVASWKRRYHDDKPLYIPAGTEGRYLSDQLDDGSHITMLDYEHSTLALLGKRLDANLSEDIFDPALGRLEPAEAAEAISLLATLVRSETLRASSDSAPRADPIEAGLSVLQEASRELSNTKDIVTVVCDTLDTFMQEESAGSSEPTLAVLAACMEFLDAALDVCPGRVWSYMARCQLLNSDSRAGRLARITGASEMASERFHFLLSSMRFFSNLVGSVSTSAVQRKLGGKSDGRQRTSENPWLGTSDRVLAQVSLAVAQTAIDVFENTSTWRFESEVHCSMVVRDVVSVMDKVLLQVYGFGQPDSSHGLLSCLKPAAEFITESFLSSSSASLRFQPLLATLLVGLDLPDSTLYQQRAKFISERLTAVLGFLTSLLRVGAYLGKSSLVIQTQLFKATTLLARLCVVRDSYKVPVLVLLGTLVTSAGSSANEPPSLLGYLGPQISRSFLKVLSNLDKPLKRSRETAAVWKFFSAVLRNRQQWMANCLLTGRMPREVPGETDKATSQLPADSILGIAKEALCSISSNPAVETLAVLDFFTAAQNFWPWTIFAAQSENAHLSQLCNYVKDLQATSRLSNSDPLRACQQTRIAAYIAETFAMQLYHLRQIGKEEAFAKEVAQFIDYYLREGVRVRSYNGSLHENFKKNFAKFYPGCSLDDFTRTLLSPQELGSDYYYAIGPAERILGFKPDWLGPSGTGFKAEMERANLNLSLVDAEIALFHGWEFLLLELSICLVPGNAPIVKQMLQVATQCLDENQNSQGPERIFVDIWKARANLSLLLTQRLADCSMLPRDNASLLSTIWASISGIEEPFSAFQIEYYRTHLKILYIVLRGASQGRLSPGETGEASAEVSVGASQVVLNILDRVVAQGFRALVSLIHDPGATVYPDDVALMTAILQACLNSPGMDGSHTQILNILASQDVLHTASSLFSWSDKLADKGDPVHGELSLLFLREASAIPEVAEQLACDGLLGHLISANLATHMRRPNVSPISDSIGAQRCYSIWVKGLLPILLNILLALGATVAPEIAFVLKQFPNLLESSVQRFEAPGLSRTSPQTGQQYITLLAVSEIHSLALLTRVLSVLRLNNNRDIAEVPWEAGTLLENVEQWLSRPKLLRERLLPLGPREIEWKNTAPETPGSTAESRLEEKVMSLLEAVQTVLGENPDE